jgi:hypothetical protein
MAPPKQTRLVQVKLRISNDLKRRLDKEARKREDGSLSAEIAERLEQSFTFPSLKEAVTTTVAEQLPSLREAVTSAIADQLHLVRFGSTDSLKKEDKP